MAKKKKRAKGDEPKGGETSGTEAEQAVVVTEPKELTAESASQDLFDELQKIRKENERLLTRQAQDKEQIEEIEMLASSEIDATKEQAEFELTMAKEKIKSLEVDMANLEIIKQEKCRLQDALDSLQSEMAERSHEHALETHNIKKEAFHARIQLESTFRKTLQECDQKHQEQAFEEMDAESKNALIEQARVKDELALQTMGIEALTNRYTSQSDTLRSLRRDNDILKEHQVQQTTKIATLRLQMTKMEEEAKENRETIETLKRESDQCVYYKTKLQAIERETQEMKQENGQLRGQVEKYRGRVQTLSDKIRQLNKEKRGQGASNLEREILANPGVSPSLLETLAKAGTSNQIAPGGLYDRNKVMRLHHETTQLTRDKLADEKTLNHTVSMPALKKSEYSGILEMWNSKFAAEKRRGTLHTAHSSSILTKKKG